MCPRCVDLMSSMRFRPDRGDARREAHDDGDPARDNGSLLCEAAVPKFDRERKRCYPRGRVRLSRGEGHARKVRRGPTWIVLVGNVRVF